MALELKTEDQTDFDYNRFFYATMCHVCKRFGDDVPLKRCSGCKLISYCGPQHQKQHWAQHKTFCKALRDVLKDGGLEKLEITSDNWNYTISTLIQTVTEKKGYLELYESQMFFYPQECAVCYNLNFESLIVCRNCALSFCKNHEDDNAHQDACAALQHCLHIYLSGIDNENILNMYLQRTSETTCTFLNMTNMKDFINSYGNIEEGHSETSYDILAAILSEQLTRPLTLLHAIQLLNYIPKSKELVIHVVVASNFEEYIMKVWEILLHLIMKIESLVIVLIRSRFNESHSLSTCDNCLSQGKKISLKFHRGLYEDYVHSPSFVKPNFVVGFNVDIQGDDTYVAEITMLSIKMIAKQNCLFLLTNHTQKKLEESIKRINSILNNRVDYFYIYGKNPFASLRPQRSIREQELVFYFNNFIAVYRSLRSDETDTN